MKESIDIIQVGNIVHTGNWGDPQRGRIYSPEGIAPALNTCGGGGLEPRQDGISNTITTVWKDNLLMEPCIGAMRGRDKDNPSFRGKTLKIPQATEKEYLICEKRNDEGLRFFKDNICGILRTIDCCGDKLIIEMETEEQFQERMNSVCREIQHTNKTETQKARLSFRIRKLTPRECFRLMGVDEKDIDKIQNAGISNSQQYKLAGNSIVVDVLYNIFRKMFVEKENESPQGLLW